MAERAVYSVSEAAKILGVSSAKVYDMVRLGEIPAVKLGIRVTKISRRALEEYVGKVYESYESAYSIDELREVLDIGKTAVHRLVKDGTLPSYRIGSRRLVPKEAVERLLSA